MQEVSEHVREFVPRPLLAIIGCPGSGKDICT